MNDKVEASIAKFQISEKDAALNFRSRVENHKVLSQSIVPSDFNSDVIFKKVERIHAPFWLFSVSAESAWNGRNSRTETYTEYETVLGPGPYDSKQVPHTRERTVYDPVNGTHFDNYIQPVLASNYIKQLKLNELNFNFSNFRPYDESYHDGGRVCAADLHKQEAMAACKTSIENLEWRACSAVPDILDGCSTKVDYIDAHFVLYPFFSLAYTYKGKPYHNLIDGITGKVQGDIPENKAVKYLLRSVKMALIAVVVLVLVIIFSGFMNSY